MPRRRPLLALLAAAVLAGLPALVPRPAAAAGTADLAVAVVAEKKSLRFGESMTLTATATNLGPDPATGVALGLGTSDSYANFGGTCPDGSVSGFCGVGTLAPGASVAVGFVVMAANACCPDRLGVAVASVSHDADTVDPVTGNDSARVETRLKGKAPF